MIPSPDFRIDISITIAEEVVRMGCLVIGAALATWGTVKMTEILFGKQKDQTQETDVK